MKKILLLSDDIRMPSGVGTMSRSIVEGLKDKYKWVQMGAALNHPAKDAKEPEKIHENITIYPVSGQGYGNPDLVRQIMQIEQPDAMMLFTDPRYWVWLWEMEDEIRDKIPILYYHVWDDLPYPHYNRWYYESCDWIGAISRQTENLVKQVIKDLSVNMVDYIPHGIDETAFFSIPDKETNQPYQSLKQTIFGDNEFDFVVLYNNRNIKRKMPSDCMAAFSEFVRKLPKEKQDKCAMVFHTNKIDPNGTDLGAVHQTLFSDINIIFSENKITEAELNFLYNMSDVTINLASNEGYGLATAESLMAGTPIIANVTGGLQDQMFEELKFTKKWGSNHDGKVKKHGDWCIPIFPSNISIQGSPPTPYIYDDRADYRDATKAFKKLYDMGPEERAQMGERGRNFMLSEVSGMSKSNMCSGIDNGIKKALKNFKPRKRFHLIKV